MAKNKHYCFVVKYYVLKLSSFTPSIKKIVFFHQYVLSYIKLLIIGS